ncbi:murein transglycosylase domain-containing protein [Desulfonatronovibrio hydrogenovorans]|uniref:murein transglycosylase domain-containing protein n=1 Tax=Desulfonatronovibrio hydrogenovorans TaxID=53245 RepID=UPI00048AFA9F|nr:murein transglycosylase domain-containing protein [Desulfonatronovibrio hydrogenovorans]
MNRREFLLGFSVSALVLGTGCKATDVHRAVSLGEQVARGTVPGFSSAVPSTGVGALDSLIRQQLQSMLEKLIKEWGDEKIPTPKEYVKYTDDYQTRAVVNFETGVIRVETVDRRNPQEKLRTAIINTLLTPEDPGQVDLLSDREVNVGGEPFLLNVVRDHENQPVRWEWRAGRFADHLMRTASKTDTYNNRRRHFVTFNMIREHNQGQQRRFQNHVMSQSRRFNLEPALVYAIIEAESSFNPYAVSHVPAYGLMQIVPETGGRDAHRLIYNRDGIPTRDYLFVPENNIRMGSAYLHILFTRYLARVSNARSREYCVIAGYNTGSGNVLRAFDRNRDQAFNRINSMNSTQVYNHLVRNLPYQETRDYLPKVVRFKAGYR